MYFDPAESFHFEITQTVQLRWFHRVAIDFSGRVQLGRTEHRQILRDGVAVYEAYQVQTALQLPTDARLKIGRAIVDNAIPAMAISYTHPELYRIGSIDANSTICHLVQHGMEKTIVCHAIWPPEFCQFDRDLHAILVAHGLNSAVWTEVPQWRQPPDSAPTDTSNGSPKSFILKP